MIFFTLQVIKWLLKKNCNSILICKLLSTHYEEYCELLGLEDQRNELAWFDDFDQDVFNFKHKIHS